MRSSIDKLTTTIQDANKPALSTAQRNSAIPAKTAARAERPAGSPIPSKAVPTVHEIAADAPQRPLPRGLIAGLLAIVVVPVLLLMVWPAVSTQGIQPTARAALAKLTSSDWVTRILAVGHRSPSGIDASRMTADQALQRAESAIFDTGGKPNIDERKFWLRKSITLMLAEPQSRWAVTQLGALHTAANHEKRKPDYRSAKTLWEIASASGDTVATCFLAQLYELGLGVIASDEQAKKWFKRADRRGGCHLKHEQPTPALTN